MAIEPFPVIITLDLFKVTWNRIEVVVQLILVTECDVVGIQLCVRQGKSPGNGPATSPISTTGQG